MPEINPRYVPGRFVTNCALKPLCDPNMNNNCPPKFLENPCRKPISVTTWKVNYLVSNQSNQAAHIDADLINPWGIVIYDNQIWSVNGGSDSLTNYDIYGNKLLSAASVRNPNGKSSYPTGIAVNCDGNFLKHQQQEIYHRPQYF